VRLRAKRIVGIDLAVYADLINVLDAGAVDASDSLSSTPPPRLQEPRWLRLGMEYRY
jgi:hypothetical protein